MLLEWLVTMKKKLNKRGESQREIDRRQDAKIEQLTKEEIKDDKKIERLTKEVVKLKHHEKEEHKKKRAVKGSVTLKFGNGKQGNMAKQGQSGTATASEFDQNGAPFTVAHPDGLQWSTSDANGTTVVAKGDGTPTATVTVGASTPAGDYTVTFTDPDAPNLQVSPAPFNVEAAQAVATTGSVELGPFA